MRSGFVRRHASALCVCVSSNLFFASSSSSFCIFFKFISYMNILVGRENIENGIRFPSKTRTMNFRYWKMDIYFGK